MFVLPIVRSWGVRCKHVTDFNFCCVLNGNRSDVYKVRKYKSYFAKDSKGDWIFASSTINIHPRSKRFIPLSGLLDNIPNYISDDIVFAVSNYNRDILFWLEGVLLECKFNGSGEGFPVIVCEDGVFRPAIYNTEYDMLTDDNGCSNSHIRCYNAGKEAVLRMLL